MLSAYDDDYVVDEPSDEDDFSDTSSEDDVQTFLKNVCGERKAADSDDDFEKEMNREVDNHLKKMEKLQKDANVSANTRSDSSETTSKTSQRSTHHADSDEETGVKNSKEGRKEPTNDELLYDPDMDDQDQKWIDDKRRHYLCRPEKQANSEKPQPLPTSDAVLNCPACMSLLCMDCQRHEIYKTQYRAMFVMNCTVDFSQELVYPVKKKKAKKRHCSENFTATSSQQHGEELYHAVHCTVCNSEVGVYDNNEVYHFFNVLASFP